MTIETPVDPVSASDDLVVTVTPPERRPLPLILAGVGGACVLGLVIGLWARPEIAVDTRQVGSMKPVAATAADQMQIAIDRDEPLPPVTKGGKLELMTAPARATPVSVPVSAPVVRPVAATPVVDREPAAHQGPSFDCDDASSVSEDLVCGDSRLSALDRRLAGAWQRAVESGAPMGRLRRQQQRWLEAREAAAREAPEDVSSLYDQRIEELDSLARNEDWDR